MNRLFTIFIGSFLLPSVALSQQVLFEETFANGSLQNVWYPGYNGNNMEVEFMSGNPSGDSWVGKLGNDLSGGAVGESFSGEPTWTDFYYEAWVYVPVDTPSAGTYYGLEFRVDSVGNSSAYQFVARFKEDLPDRKLRFRYRPSSGFPSVLKDWEPADIPGGIPDTAAWHHMAVEAIGNQFRFFFNGNELPGGPFTDETLSGGWVGAYVFDFVNIPSYLFIDDLKVTATTTGIEEQQPQLALGYKLHQNYPNPFNPSTKIDFDIPNSEFVTLTIYNSLGQTVQILVNSELSAGPHEVQWNGQDESGRVVPAGVYYYQINAGNFQSTRKMLLVK